jgi:hypothetical protein
MYPISSHFILDTTWLESQLHHCIPRHYAITPFISCTWWPLPDAVTLLAGDFSVRVSACRNCSTAMLRYFSRYAYVKFSNMHLAETYRSKKSVVLKIINTLSIDAHLHLAEAYWRRGSTTEHFTRLLTERHRSLLRGQQHLTEAYWWSGIIL